MFWKKKKVISEREAIRQAAANWNRIPAGRPAEDGATVTVFCFRCLEWPAEYRVIMNNKRCPFCNHKIAL